MEFFYVRENALIPSNGRVRIKNNAWMHSFCYEIGKDIKFAQSDGILRIFIDPPFSIRLIRVAI